LFAKENLPYRMTPSDEELPRQTETPDSLRHLAGRARHFAELLQTDDAGRLRLIEFAKELEAKATRLNAIETNSAARLALESR
jgi:hypothetical protein